MLQSFYRKATSFLLLFILVNPSTQINRQTQSQQLENLKAFTKLYGYIRFFHPSDEASQIDWNKFAVYGLEKVKNAKNESELKEILKALFYPIAPTIQIYSSNEKPKGISEIFPKDTAGLKIVAWQHFGVGLSEKASYYKSIRVFSNSIVGNLSAILQTRKNIDSSPRKVKLFEKYPQVDEVINQEILPGLFCLTPLTLVSNPEGTIGKNDNYHFSSLESELEKILPNDLSADNENVRLANVVLTWNVLQHFYPYFDLEKIDWNSILNETLKESLLDKNSEDHYFTLNKMIASLQDGHGFVLFEKEPVLYGLPLHVQLIEDRIVVAFSEIPSIRKGDIILQVGNRTADEEISEKKKMVAGSPQFKLYRALIEFGNDINQGDLMVELSRDGETIVNNVNKKPKSLSSFTTGPNEFDYEPIKKIDDDIYYINLIAADDNKFYDSLNNIATAKAVIFDYRRTGKFSRDTKRLITLQMIMHLIDSTLQSPRWNIPSVIYPDRRDLSFKESNWKLQPNQPKIKGKKVFIIDSNVISHMETFMSFVEFYKLGDIVGQPSAGCNGNVNYIPLIGGFEVMFTGMKVLKHDGSQHHLIGIQPTHPVKRTIQAVKEGRDEYLEKAIEVIKTSINK